MLRVNLTIYDGCSWTHSDHIMEFKNHDELKEFIEHQNQFFNDVEIKHIETIEK